MIQLNVHDSVPVYSVEVQAGGMWEKRGASGLKRIPPATK